ncbi:MAG: ABC transporter permease [Methylococcales bacterium]|nr:ABC transporter permease [Methylococcales bacterium]
MSQPDTQARYTINLTDKNLLVLQLSGDWIIGGVLPKFQHVLADLNQYPNISQLTINNRQLGQWDSRLVSFIFRLIEYFEPKNISINLSELPDGLQRLIALATTVPERKGAKKENTPPFFLEKIGNKTLHLIDDSKQTFFFMGEVWLSILRFIQGKARFRRQDFWLISQECGPNALPIVTLISLLIGLVLAFMGAIQLRIFGADIYVANLVAIGMSREMGAMMTAIIMAGRTGAAFAAKLGTMQVNEEIDAFKTMGIAVMDFLVLPRLLALVIMLPLLTVYSNIIGILGGMWVAVGLMDISLLEYYQQTTQSITLIDCSTGILKSFIFGILIAGIGCMSGLQCGRSSSAVGDAATTAVVRSIVCIVIADAIFTLLFESLGI